MLISKLVLNKLKLKFFKTPENTKAYHPLYSEVLLSTVKENSI